MDSGRRPSSLRLQHSTTPRLHSVHFSSDTDLSKLRSGATEEDPPSPLTSTENIARPDSTHQASSLKVVPEFHKTYPYRSPERTVQGNGFIVRDYGQPDSPTIRTAPSRTKKSLDFFDTDSSDVEETPLGVAVNTTSPTLPSTKMMASNSRGSRSRSVKVELPPPEPDPMEDFKSLSSSIDQYLASTDHPNAFLRSFNNSTGSSGQGNGSSQAYDQDFNLNNTSDGRRNEPHPQIFSPQLNANTANNTRLLKKVSVQTAPSINQAPIGYEANGPFDPVTPLDDQFFNDILQDTASTTAKQFARPMQQTQGVGSSLMHTPSMATDDRALRLYCITLQAMLRDESTKQPLYTPTYAPSVYTSSAHIPSIPSVPPTSARSTTFPSGSRKQSRPLSPLQEDGPLSSHTSGETKPSIPIPVETWTETKRRNSSSASRPGTKRRVSIIPPPINTSPHPDHTPPTTYTPQAFSESELPGRKSSLAPRGSTAQGSAIIPPSSGHHKPPVSTRSSPCKAETVLTLFVRRKNAGGRNSATLVIPADEWHPAMDEKHTVSLRFDDEDLFKKLRQRYYSDLLGSTRGSRWWKLCFSARTLRGIRIHASAEEFSFESGVMNEEALFEQLESPSVGRGKHDWVTELRKLSSPAPIPTSYTPTAPTIAPSSFPDAAEVAQDRLPTTPRRTSQQPGSNATSPFAAARERRKSSAARRTSLAATAAYEVMGRLAEPLMDRSNSAPAASSADRTDKTNGNNEGDTLTALHKPSAARLAPPPRADSVGAQPPPVPPSTPATPGFSSLMLGEPGTTTPNATATLTIEFVENWCLGRIIFWLVIVFALAAAAGLCYLLLGPGPDVVRSPVADVGSGFNSVQERVAAGAAIFVAGVVLGWGAMGAWGWVSWAVM